MTEAELQAAVIDLAHLLGYTIAHFRPARTAKGWRTPVQADGAGFPDLVLARPERRDRRRSVHTRPGRLVFAELKSATGDLTGDERRWMDVLAEAGQEWYLWRPTDWLAGRVEEVLR